MQWLFAVAGILVVGSAVMAAMGFRGREQVVGIDLGTTFSVVAIRSKDVVTVLPDRFTGKLLVPSVVAYLKNGTKLIGADARGMREEYPLQTIFNAKRFIGRPINDVQEDAKSHPYNVTVNVSDADNPAGAAGFSIPQRSGQPDKWMSPIDVGADIVKHMKLSIAKYIGYPIHRAVICVPAKFTKNETAATAAAFAKGGIKVMRVLDEPTAAAVAYNLHKGEGVRHVMVYDIGGGTLDTSLLFMNGKSVSVLGIAGDDRLGGSDFDQAMRGLLQKKLESIPAPKEAEMIQDSSLIRPGLHRCDSSNLFVLGEEAKIALSASSETAVHCLGTDNRVRELRVTRAEFEEVSKDLFDRCMAPVDKVLEDQMMTVDNVNDVVLVGGASRMPRLREMLKERFGDKKMHTEIDPDVTVAYGAANIVD